MMQQWCCSVMIQQQMQLEAMKAQIMQEKDISGKQQKQPTQVKPQGLISVAAVRDIPHRLQLSDLKSAIEAQLPGTKVGAMLGLWNKGIVLVGLHGGSFGKTGPKLVELEKLRDHRGRAPSMVRSEKPGVKTLPASRMLNARFIYEDPSQDLPPEEFVPGFAERYSALESSWPGPRETWHGEEEVLGYGRLLEQGGAGEWKELAMPLNPKRETEQVLKRKYFQLFFIFADTRAAAAAMESADGLRVIHNGLPVVIRLEPVQLYSIKDAPRIPKPLASPKAKGKSYVPPHIEQQLNRRTSDRLAASASGSSSVPGSPRACASPRAGDPGGSISSLATSDYEDSQKVEEEEDCPPPLVEDEEVEL